MHFVHTVYLSCNARNDLQDVAVRTVACSRQLQEPEANLRDLVRVLNGSLQCGDLYGSAALDALQGQSRALWRGLLHLKQRQCVTRVGEHDRTAPLPMADRRYVGRLFGTLGLDVTAISAIDILPSLVRLSRVSIEHTKADTKNATVIVT